jgi:hypothetical protein
VGDLGMRENTRQTTRIMTTQALGINPELLQGFLHDSGPSLGLEVGHRDGVAACWAAHPDAVHDIVGLFLAWSGLLATFTTDPRGPGALAAPAPRDWLDLSNASAAAVTRITESTRTCARAGHHIGGEHAADLTQVKAS